MSVHKNQHIFANFFKSISKDESIYDILSCDLPEADFFVSNKLNLLLISDTGLETRFLRSHDDRLNLVTS